MNGFTARDALRTRDERERQVDLQADRLSYTVVTYGLLVLAMGRALVRGEAAWDLLALVVLGGFVNTIYRARGRALSRSWLALMLVTMAACALVAGVLAALVSHVI